MAIPDQPFGFVAGRWVLSKADTPMDSDRAPDYEPLHPGSVVFNNKLSHRVVNDGSGTVGIVKTRIEARLNGNGDLIDAEGHKFIALPVGVYSVSFSFGQYSWPNFDIEVKAEHTIDSPLWLPSKSPVPAGPGIVHVVSEEARLAAEAAAASAWEAVDTPGRQGPKGDRGPMGSIEGLAGAPQLTNLFHGTTRTPINSTINSQTVRTVAFTATARNGHVRPGGTVDAGATYYFTAAVKASSDQVYIGTIQGSASHSGSGGWERLTGRFTPPSSLWFTVTDQRSSGWDQIEVLDLVLINLTEVFGAGREPSKEYMDALLAKHGNYIGAVDQFAVGDALQALTVAGSGMTLRHDTTVGTRVLLDHPGGTTMLYGDTGWRNIPVPTDVPGVTVLGPAPFRIRRVGDVVYAYIDRLTFTGDYVTGSLVIEVGAGFAPRGLYMPHAGYPSGNSRTMMWTSTRLTVYDGTPVVDGRWMWTFMTSDPWPTTLPGTSAQ